MTHRTCIVEPAPCSINGNCHECSDFDGFELTMTVCHGCGKLNFCTRLTHRCFDCLAAAQLPRPEPGQIAVQHVAPGIVQLSDHDRIIQSDHGALSTVYRWPADSAHLLDWAPPTAHAADALEGGAWGE